MVASIAPRFAGYEQQDAHEFVVFLLDALIDDTNEVPAKAAYRELTERAEDSDARVADLWWRYMSEHCSSRVRDIFTGQLKTAVRCAACGHVSRAFDTFTTLSLPLPVHGGGGGGGALALDECLRAFTATAELSGDNASYCSRCRTHQTSAKTMTLFRLPPLLIVHLKRFSSPGGGGGGGGGFGGYGYGRRSTKIDVDVRFPRGAERLDLRPFLPDGAPAAAPGACTTYTCVGVSNHSGGLSGGHYTADAFNCDAQAWHHFNDSHVSRASERDLADESAAAYMIFYLRLDCTAGLGGTGV